MPDDIADEENDWEIGTPIYQIGIREPVAHQLEDGTIVPPPSRTVERLLDDLGLTDRSEVDEGA